MKKLSRLLLLMHLFFAISIVGTAQKTLRLGFKGGISIPNLKASGDNEVSEGYGSRLGPDFAVFAEFALSKSISLQPQLELSGQGGKKNGNQAIPTSSDPALAGALAFMLAPQPAPEYIYADFKSDAKINYLMLPILVKSRFDLGKSINLYAAAGPFISYVITAKRKTSGSSYFYLDKQHTQPLVPFGEQSFDGEEDIKDELHKFNAGVEAAIGVSFAFGRHELFVEGGGNYGLVKIQKDDTNGQNNTGAAMITIGYAFRLKN